MPNVLPMPEDPRAIDLFLCGNAVSSDPEILQRRADLFCNKVIPQLEKSTTARITREEGDLLREKVKARVQFDLGNIPREVYEDLYYNRITVDQYKGILNAYKLNAEGVMPESTLFGILTGEIDATLFKLEVEN